MVEKDDAQLATDQQDRSVDYGKVAFQRSPPQEMWRWIGLGCAQADNIDQPANDYTDFVKQANDNRRFTERLKQQFGPEGLTHKPQKLRN